MKQLTCEMCGGTDLVKDGGVFVCQSCGTKYSVEEAKKMMIEGTVEVQGNVNVQNAAQLENLLNLAHSSFDAKNYAQAENFCNQVIAMDDKNYDAWKLKGEAINYQINANNQRILEVYNCIMTSYRILNDEQKEEKKQEILSSLKNCFEGEITFWLKQFETNRPTDSALTRVKNSYTDSYNKMAAAFDELGLEDSKKGYLVNFSNFFIKECVGTCNEAWASTVAYNYYRDYFGKSINPFERKDTRWVITDTDLYRPTKNIWDTFVNESDNLIKLLQFAEKQFNDETDLDIVKTVYSNIAYIEERVIPSCSWHITRGATSNWDTEYTVGWREEYYLTDDAKAGRRIIMNNYKKKADDTKAEIVDKTNKQVAKESENMPVEAMEAIAFHNLNEKNYVEAEARFDAVIEKKPKSPIGYAGKALAVYGADKGGKTALEVLKNGIQYQPDNDEEKDDLKFLLNYQLGNYNVTLLMIAAANYYSDLVEYAVKNGADVNTKESNNVTALWFVCYKKPDDSNVEAARKIAKCLLDNGADVNVVNKGGVSLYNKKTDKQIVQMILNKYPGAVKGNAAGGSGCYVATCVYGSYDCPQVWTLRRFRDDTLASTWYGRAFIHTYYAISPTIVKWFGNTKWFKKMWKGKLDRMVENLQKSGVEDTPYKDKDWR